LRWFQVALVSSCAGFKLRWLRFKLRWFQVALVSSCAGFKLRWFQVALVFDPSWFLDLDGD